MQRERLNNQAGEVKVKLLLDSGAFSAWTRNRKINLQEYIDYIKAHKKFIWKYVNLDVIPGRLGQPRSSREVELSAQASYDNLKKMQAQGLRPLPVFHQGENFEWLKRMVDEGEDYIGISPADDELRSNQQEWMDKCFTMLTDKEGRPLVKTHGFGVLNPIYLGRYPWYTTDGTTWALSAGYGWCLVPSPKDGGGWDYLRPTRLAITGVQREQGGNKQQFEGMPPTPQGVGLRWLQDVVGIEDIDLRYGTFARRQAMLTYYQELARLLEPVRFRCHNEYKFFPFPKFHRRPRPIENLRLIPIMATFTDATRSRVLNHCGMRHRLLSYYHLKDMSEDEVRNYVRTGGAAADSVPRTPSANWKNPAYLSHIAQKRLKRMRGINGTQSVREES